MTLDRVEYDLGSSEALQALLEPAHERANVIIDLSAVKYLDSASIEKLSRVRRERARKGMRPAKLVIESAQVRRLFEILKFDRLWAIFTTLDEALREARRPD
ncbi:MAG TPA: STAS domain-containing protein [Candidatus Tumulicola sp.]|nr:STAS domain-containing protein [Candidatus Tumulicola sp.]